MIGEHGKQMENTDWKMSGSSESLEKRDGKMIQDLGTLISFGILVFLVFLLEFSRHPTIKHED